MLNNYNNISKNSVKILEISAITALIISMILPDILFERFSFTWNTIMGALVLIWAVAAFIYIPAYCKSIVYKLGNDDFILKKGIILKKIKILKRKNILFVSLVQTPFTPVFKTYTIVLNSPGAFLKIPYLSSEQAYALLRSFSTEKY